MKITDININQLAFIRGIGMTETDLDRKEAYSEEYNNPKTNEVVRDYGQIGADYGYYQTNELDVRECIKYGVPKEIAVHLNGGGKHGTSTLEEQTIAMHYYLTKKYPKTYEQVKKGTPEAFEKARSVMDGHWFGLRDQPDFAREQFRRAKSGDYAYVFPELFKKPK